MMDNQQLSPYDGESSQTISVKESTWVVDPGKRCTYIYSLTDPITKQVRYIGKTVSPLYTRLSGHMCEAHRPGTSRTHKRNWLKSLANRGLMPIIEVVETIPPNGDWESAERYYIEQLRYWGYNLLNVMDGGDGASIGHKQSATTKWRRSQKLLNRPRPQDVRNKISKSHKGKVLNETTKEKLRQSNLGKKNPGSQNGRKKPVTQVLKDGTELVYPSVTVASEATGIGKGSICNVCRGTCKSAGGFKWKYTKI